MRYWKNFLIDCNMFLVVEEISILTVHSPDVGPVMKTKMKDKV